MSNPIPTFSRASKRITRSHAYLAVAAVALVAGTAVSAYALTRLYRGNVVVGGPVVTRTVPAECPAPAVPECPECGRLTYADAPEPLPALPAGWTYSVNAGEDWLLAHPADWEYVEDSEDWRKYSNSFFGSGGDLVFYVKESSPKPDIGFDRQQFVKQRRLWLERSEPITGDSDSVRMLPANYRAYDGFEEFPGQIYIVPAGDDIYFWVGAYSMNSDFEKHRPTVEKVVRSLRAL
jgi:hypothetical protein